MKGSQAVCHSTLLPGSLPKLRLTVISPERNDPANEFSEFSQEAVLVQRCLAGEQEAWSELIEKYRALIYSIARRFGAGYYDAGDIFQAVCIEAFNNLSHLRKAGSLRSWLITVTVRQAFQWRKKQGNDIPLDDMEAGDASEIAVLPDINDKLWEKQQARIVREGMDQLPARSAELLRLLFFEQPPLPYQEVARRLCLATGSIGFIRGRALNKLRKILTDAGFDSTGSAKCRR
jgi:RNA polymerase sigma factor (sigma-70 family)